MSAQLSKTTNWWLVILAYFKKFFDDFVFAQQFLRFRFIGVILRVFVEVSFLIKSMLDFWMCHLNCLFIKCAYLPSVEMCGLFYQARWRNISILREERWKLRGEKKRNNISLLNCLVFGLLSILRTSCGNLEFVWTVRKWRRVGCWLVEASMGDPFDSSIYQRRAACLSRTPPLFQPAPG